jgi:hypothetical protein
VAMPSANRPPMLKFLAAELPVADVQSPPLAVGANVSTMPTASVVTGVSALGVMPLQEMQHAGEFVPAAAVLAAWTRSKVPSLLPTTL